LNGFLFSKERRHKAYGYTPSYPGGLFYWPPHSLQLKPLHLKHANVLHLMVLSLLTLFTDSSFSSAPLYSPQGFHLAIKCLNPQNYIKKSLTANL
jgi:hypothetical protein